MRTFLSSLISILLLPISLILFIYLFFDVDSRPDGYKLRDIFNMLVFHIGECFIKRS